MKTLIIYSLLILPFSSVGQRIGADHAQLGTLRDSVVTNSQILFNPQLYVATEDGKLSSYYSVSRFELTITNPTGELLLATEITSGNKLSKLQLNTIKELEPDSKLKFEEIIGTCADCRNFKLPSFTIQIK